MQKKLIYRALFCCFLWATAVPVIKISYLELNILNSNISDSIILAGIRFSLAGILIIIYSKFKNFKFNKLPKVNIKQALFFGFMSTTLGYLTFYIGVANTSAIKVSLIESSKPILTVIFAHFFTTDDKLNTNKIIGIFLGIIGIFIMNINSIFGNLNGSFNLLGEGILSLTVATSVFCFIYGKKVLTTMNSIQLNMIQLTFGGFILLITGLLGSKGFHLHFTTLSLILLIYSSFLSAIAFILWYSLISEFGSSKVSMCLLFLPILGAFISSIVFVNEHFTLSIILSLIVMTFATYMVNKPKKCLD